MWYKKRYYNTDNGIVDISKYDDNEKIKFFIVNPNAVEATERETRDVGLTRPNSEIVSEENRIASELEEKEKDKFIYLKYGTMNQRSGTYMGGKGDNVYREDFENDAEWERYQMWNTGITDDLFFIFWYAIHKFYKVSFPFLQQSVGSLPFFVTPYHLLWYSLKHISFKLDQFLYKLSFP